MPSKSKGPSQRQLRVGELIRKALSSILLRTDIQDPQLNGISFTVAEVSVSPDMRNAKVFVMPLASEAQEELVSALGRHAKFLRGELSRQVQLKYMPNLRFELDRSFIQSEHIDALLRSPKVSRDLE